MLIDLILTNKIIQWVFNTFITFIFMAGLDLLLLKIKKDYEYTLLDALITILIPPIASAVVVFLLLEKL